MSLLVNYSNAISIIDIGVSLIPDRKENIEGFPYEDSFGGADKFH